MSGVDAALSPSQCPTCPHSLLCPRATTSYSSPSLFKFINSDCRSILRSLLEFCAAFISEITYNAIMQRKVASIERTKINMPLMLLQPKQPPSLRRWLLNKETETKHLVFFFNKLMKVFCRYSSMPPRYGDYLRASAWAGVHNLRQIKTRGLKTRHPSTLS